MFDISFETLGNLPDFGSFGSELGDIAGGLGLTASNLGSTLGSLGSPNFYPGEGAGAFWPSDLGLPSGSPAALASLAGEGGSFFKGLGDVAGAALPFVKTGIGLGGLYAGIRGLESARGNQGTLDRATKQSEAAAAPGIAAAQKLIPAGTDALLGGPLPPQLEAELESKRANEKAKARQALAKMGINDSTAAAQVDAWIDLQIEQLKGQLAAGLLQAGNQSVPGGVVGQAAQIAGNQLSGTANAVSAAQQAAFNLLGRV